MMMFGLKKYISLKYFLISFVSFLLLAQTQVYAASAQREVSVLRIHPMAAVRPAGGSNLIRIYVDVAPWGQTACRNDAVDFKKEDTHLMSTLLWGVTMKRTIIVEVDDTLLPFDDVCQATALFIQ